MNDPNADAPPRLTDDPGPLQRAVTKLNRPDDRWPGIRTFGEIIYQAGIEGA